MALHEPWKYEKCDECGDSKEKFESCKKCAQIERMKGVECPCCKSTNVKENNITKSNGVFGPGHHTSTVFSYILCLDCGVMFQKIEK